MISLKVKKLDLRVMSWKPEESIHNARFDETKIKLLVSGNKSRIHKVIISWNLLEKEIEKKKLETWKPIQRLHKTQQTRKYILK